ncbi:MAG: CHAT domain-containing protein, partial [Phycisphaerales bacterium JB059]
GDTVMSLPIGFFAAGAETVVASLWRVDDAATALLMARFYENLLGQTDASRSVFGREYEAGQAMPKLDALGEARAWLRSLDREQAERARRGLDRSLSRAPGARRVEQPEDAQHPYAHPRYWAPFVLIGNAD